MPRSIVSLLSCCGSLLLLAVVVHGDDTNWSKIEAYFHPPAEFAGNLGDYRSPLMFDDGTRVASAADWPRRRAEIRAYWDRQVGAWPPLLDKPRIEMLESERVEGYTRHRIRVEVATNKMKDAFLLVPDGPGPFPAVMAVYYNPETGAGLGRELRDYGRQLTLRGFVTLSLGYYGFDPRRPYVADERCQRLWFLAYMAANGQRALASLPEVDGDRVGIVGQSLGGKWAMVASCLHDGFACGAWSEGGIVFDESIGNVNYWEPWYLGFDPDRPRTPGRVTAENPRTGPYARLIEEGRNLHELHALMAPRPFLVSGGACDPVRRWIPLNHSLAVNALLGHDDRVGMTNRAGHYPTEESNQQIYDFFIHVLRPGAFAKEHSNTPGP